MMVFNEDYFSVAPDLTSLYIDFPEKIIIYDKNDFTLIRLIAVINKQKDCRDDSRDKHPCRAGVHRTNAMVSTPDAEGEMSFK